MQTNEEHVTKPGVCPRCDSDCVEWYSFDVVDVPNDGAEAHQEANCMECDFMWDDVYTLTGFVHNEQQEEPNTCTITGKPEPDDDHDIYEIMAKRIKEGTPDPQSKSGLSCDIAKEKGITVLNIRLSEKPNWEALLGFIEVIKAGLSEEK